MPILTNPKHERFAQELAKGKTATEAYVLAGYKANDGNAATLKGNQRILDRVSDLLERGAERAVVTAASLIEEAEAVRAAAFAAGQFAPAIAAIKEKGVLAGVRVEKRETGIRSLNEMTDDELAHIASGRSEAYAGASSGAAKPH